MGLSLRDIEEAREKIRRLRTYSSSLVHWRTPISLFGKEDESAKRTYKRLCEIPHTDWNMKSGVVSEILQLFSKHIKDKMEKAQGSTATLYFKISALLTVHGKDLKVKDADEFDVLMPFSFRNQNIKFVTTSENMAIPPGHAEVHVTCGPSEWFDKYKMVNLHGVLLSRIVHERYFRGLIEGAMVDINTLIGNERNSDIAFNIRMSTNPPAITIHIAMEDINHSQPLWQVHTHPMSVFTFPGLRTQAAAVTECPDKFNIDVDIVPGLLMDSASCGESRTCSRYLFTRWFHESQNDDPSLQDHLNNLWRISYSDYEISILDMCREGSREEQYFIITAVRIVNSLQKETAARCPSDQFPSVFKSYYMKTMLLYALLYFTRMFRMPIPSVSVTLACYVIMLQISLRKRKLLY